MKVIFKWISNIIKNRPVKTLLITILIFTLMITGATQIRMATGNETLVKTTSDAYKSNLSMEKDFGGDSIIVLFEGKNQEDILSKDNIRKMWDVENNLKYEEDIYSFMSPATVVNQISNKQSEEIKNRVKTISDGLDEMSNKMEELGVELSNKDLKDPKEIEEKLKGLSQVTVAFDKLIKGQDEMAKGTAGLEVEITGVSERLSSVSLQLKQLADNPDNNPQMAMQLEKISENIEKSSQGLKTMADNTSKLNQGSKKTSLALNNMKNQISSQTGEMQGSLSGGISPDQLKEMADGFVLMGERLKELSDGLSIFYEKSNMMIADIPRDQKELDNIFYDEGKLRSMFSEVIVNDNQALMIIKLEGNLEDSDKDAIYEKLEKVLKDQEFENVSYMISGKPVLDSALRSEMKDNMKSMVGLAVGIMFIILMIIFKVRWRVLSLGIIFTAVVATLGSMGAVGIPMTMVSMAVFPILIGLGIDYSIQFHNRYEEEHSLKKTLIQMGPGIGTAVFATILGFIALYGSPVPMVQDFGKMLTIGVAISYIAGIFLLMSILYLRDKFNPIKITNEKKKSIKSSSLEKGLVKMTKVVLRYSTIILIIAITVASLGIWVDDKVGVETDIETFMPQDTEELADIHKLRDVLGSTNQIVLYIEDENILREENLNWIKDKTRDIEEKYPNVVVDTKSIISLVDNMRDNKDITYEEYIETIEDIPKSQRKIFLNEEENKTVVLLNVKHVPVETLQEFVNDLEDITIDTEMDVVVTGKSVLDVEMIKGLTTGRIKMTFIGVGLVFLGLLIVYRNIFKAFIPVFPISLIVGMSGGIMYLLGLKYTPLTATLGALILGIGTEMTILLLERYVEERKGGKDKQEAMETSVAKIGKAIIASGLTTIGGFGVLMISKFVILQDFGLMTVINMSLALFSTLIVLPPLIVWLDRWIVGKGKIVEE